MRDFRLQALVNWFKVLQKKEMDLGNLIKYGWLWLRPTKKNKVRANKLYDRRDISVLRSQMLKLGEKDPAWFPRLFEPTTLGIRSWEYGLLLSQISFRKKSVLDAGSGNSRLPKYLAKLGAKVTMLDMKEPLEETVLKKDRNLRFVLGDMTKLDFKDSYFDRVLCISAIEHVDMKHGKGFYSSEEYLERAKSAIRELARVTKRGGVFYLTTDFYLPEQKTDNWPGSVNKIRGGFPWSYIEIFIEEMKKSGIELMNHPEFSESVIQRDKMRSNYRGRYFSTFAFMGTKI